MLAKVIAAVRWSGERLTDPCSSESCREVMGAQACSKYGIYMRLRSFRDRIDGAIRSSSN